MVEFYFSLINKVDIIWGGVGVGGKSFRDSVGVGILVYKSCCLVVGYKR